MHRQRHWHRSDFIGGPVARFANVIHRVWAEQETGYFHLHNCYSCIKSLVALILAPAAGEQERQGFAAAPIPLTFLPHVALKSSPVLCGSPIPATSPISPVNSSSRSWLGLCGYKLGRCRATLLDAVPVCAAGLSPGDLGSAEQRSQSWPASSSHPSAGELQRLHNHRFARPLPVPRPYRSSSGPC